MKWDIQKMSILSLQGSFVFSWRLHNETKFFPYQAAIFFVLQIIGGKVIRNYSKERSSK